MPTLSPTMFDAGPDDSLAVVDVYNETGEKVINELPKDDELNEGLLDTIKDAGLADESMLDKMMNSLSGLAAKLKVTAKSLLEGIFSANGGLMAALKSLKQSLQNGLLNSNLFSKIQASIGGIFKTITGSNLAELSGLASMVNDLACSNYPNAFKDVAGMVSMAINLIKQGILRGLNGIFEAFAKCAKFDGTMLNMIAKEVAPWLLKNPSNQLLLEIAQSKAGKFVFQTFPNYINQYFMNYRNATGSRNSFAYYNQNQRRAVALDAMNPGTSNTDYYNEYSTMFTAFSLMNPNWLVENNQINGNLIVGSSPYMQRAVQAGVDGNFILLDTSDPTNYDSSGQTPLEAYMLLVRNTPVSKIRPILKETFPYSRVKVF